MIRDDYILRMIDQIAAVVAKLLLKKTVKTAEEVRSDLESAAAQWIGLDYSTLLRLSRDSLHSLLSSGGKPDAEKCYAAAQLMFADARLREKQGAPEEAATLYAKSLDLLLSGTEHAAGTLRTATEETVDGIVLALESREIPLELAKKLIVHYELGGRYSHAEDLLFDLADAGDPCAWEIGEPFFRRLLEKSDTDLERGCLPRDEVEDGLAELRARVRR